MIGFALIFALMLFSCESREEGAQVRYTNIKELVGIKGCPYCHDMRRDLLGPSFYKISERYSEKDKDKLVKSILEGSMGKWGENSMPPQKVTEEEARMIVDWILNLKKKVE